MRKLAQDWRDYEAEQKRQARAAWWKSFREGALAIGVPTVLTWLVGVLIDQVSADWQNREPVRSVMVYGAACGVVTYLVVRDLVRQWEKRGGLPSDDELIGPAIIVPFVSAQVFALAIGFSWAMRAVAHLLGLAAAGLGRLVGLG